jgi:antitoxin CptB
MADSLETRRKRLAFRARHRGTKEMDLLIGSFADCHVAGMNEAQLARLEALLELPEPLLAGWVTGQEAPPPEYDDDVMTLLRNFKYPAPGV